MRNRRGERLDVARRRVAIGVPEDLEVAAAVDKRPRRALGQRIGDQESNVTPDHALVAQPAEDLVGALGLVGVAELVEADRVDAVANSQPPLIVVAARLPVLEGMSRQGQEIGVARVGVARQVGDPLGAVSELAVGEHRDVFPERQRRAPKHRLHIPAILGPCHAAEQQQPSVILAHASSVPSACAAKLAGDTAQDASAGGPGSACGPVVSPRQGGTGPQRLTVRCVRPHRRGRSA